MLTDSRWNALYILLGIYFAWLLVFLLICAWKIRSNPVKLSGKYIPPSGMQVGNGRAGSLEKTGDLTSTTEGLTTSGDERHMLGHQEQHPTNANIEMQNRGPTDDLPV